MWWRQRGRLRRTIADLVAGELARMRRSSAGLPPPPWPESLRLDQGLGADSLELLNLATALAEFIQLHRAGIEDALLARRTLGDWVNLAEAGLAHHDAELTFRTSGSSGVPKACAHAVRDLDEEVETLASLFAGTTRVLHAVPAHHIYGFLFTVLLPQRLGLAEDAVVDVRGHSPATLAGAVRDGDLVIGHPAFWAAVARAVPALPAGARGVTSTAPCPDDVSEAVERTGLCALFHIYGASETAGIGWRASHREPYELFPYWHADDAAPDTLRRDRMDQASGLPKTFPLPDAIEWLSPSRFRVRARRDGAVQVGGINVFPAHVADVIRQHPGVAEVAVRLMRPEEGTRLKAFIVPAQGTDAAQLELQLRPWLAERLTAPERPQALRLGETLPRAATGKLADWDVEAGAGQHEVEIETQVTAS